MSRERSRQSEQGRRILRALELANRLEARPVTCAEVARRLSLRDRRALRRRGKCVASVVRKYLDALVQSRAIYTPGVANNRRFFASPRIIDPNVASLPALPKKLQARLLELVEETVSHLGRGVRLDDILASVNGDEFHGVSRRRLTRGLSNLVNRGKLVVVSRTRGIPRVAYAPPDAVLGLQPPPERRDVIVRVFQELWAEQADAAAAENRLPEPLTTRDLWKRYAR